MIPLKIRPVNQLYIHKTILRFEVVGKVASISSKKLNILQSTHDLFQSSKRSRMVSFGNIDYRIARILVDNEAVVS